MRWPRRGILIRLAIYVPVIGFLAWRAQGGCEQTATMTKDDAMEQKLAPHRKVITLPDGTQQEVVELTAEEAEAILGHPIPRDLERVSEGKGGGDAKAGDAKAGANEAADVKAGDAKAGASGAEAAVGGDAKAGGDAAGAATKTGDVPANPDATSSADAKTGDVKAGSGSATK